MVTKLCLDSDVLIDILRNNEETIKKIKLLEGEFFTTTVSIFEIWNGRKKDEIIEDFISWINIIDFDENAAFLAGDIRKNLRKNGLEIDIRDLFIASMCITNNFGLFTNNKKHFERFKQFGLILI
ncbi:type II toxin-antitoxin system VapC family toxin [Candidatus Woesearchaeota archaeon]|nr:type II toxin-antitoxin system VapC family toxin [Candidatus Woesearchaeota archaeon]